MSRSIQYAAVVVLVVIVAILYGVALPSVKKSLLITNNAGEVIHVNVVAEDTRALSVDLPDGQTTTFVYFRGDYGHSTSAKVKVEAVGHLSKRRFGSTLDLPIRPESGSTNLIITTLDLK
jgi:hypothetical protein